MSIKESGDKKVLPIGLKQILLLLGLALAVVAIAIFAGPVLSLVEKVAVSSGGSYALAVMFLLSVAVPIWFMLLVRGNYLRALGLQILLLPLTYRALSVISIPAYDDGTFVQRISLTTFMLLMFWLWLLFTKVSMARHPVLRVFEILLLMFGMLTTISQLANHTFSSAILLSIGGAWQFIALFYILCSVVREGKDVELLLKCIAWAFIIAIIDRIGYGGEGFLVHAPADLSQISPHALAGEFVRVGSGAFGFAQSYGGYLSFVSILELYFVQSAPSRWWAVLWIITILTLIFEMFNTFTRGATLALLFVSMLLLWRETRRFFMKIVMVIGILMFTWLGTLLVDLATVRQLELTPGFLLSDPNSVSRMDLYVQSLPHFFDNWGLGYGIGKPLIFYTDGVGEAVSHNTIFDLSQGVGGLATVLFLLMFFIALKHLYQTTKRAAAAREARLSIYMFVGLAGWFFFANTTSTSLVYYYPYEATLIFYTVMFLAILMPTLKGMRTDSVLAGQAVRQRSLPEARKYGYAAR
ncbi:MAG: hypothetical protein DMF68_10820 [Acidobacteria bacterium]|nr:MAG: hypothetical protein DMF68_10820 [Acidobacteriota bacterium]